MGTAELYGDGGRPAAGDRCIRFEQRKERNNEEEEVYQLLSDNDQEFLRVALEHPDLRLFASEEYRAFRRAARAHVHHLQHADLAL